MNIYLIPTKASYSASKSALKQLGKNLQKAGIIGKHFEKELSRFSPGKEAAGIFEEHRKGKIPFGYIEFCCYEAPSFVPDSHGENFDASCPHCEEPIEDGVVTVAIDAFNDGEEEPFACPECDEKIELSELPCELTTAIVRFAIFIRDAASNEISRNIRDLLSEITGQRFLVLEEIP
ncbi:MAG: hypothetical protein ACYS8W_03265 [Planctomycetota bacterium]|jgi:hypothetical protein